MIIVLRRSGFGVVPFFFDITRGVIICVPGRSWGYLKAHLVQGRPARFWHGVFSGHWVSVKTQKPWPSAAAMWRCFMRVNSVAALVAVLLSLAVEFSTVSGFGAMCNRDRGVLEVRVSEGTVSMQGAA